jgi:hypothetical protein
VTPRAGGRRFQTVGLMVALAVVTPRAQVGLPDPSLMAGQALPAPELRDGTVTVRVMREAVGNNAVGETVEVTAGGESQSGVTDAEGRTEFAGLPAGTVGTATAVVDGETLVSAPFTVPTSGGLRVILFSGIGASGAGSDADAVPPVSGTVSIGSNSRVIAQFQEDALQVFYLMEFINELRVPVDIGGPVLMDLPRGAAGATVMAGSTPMAVVNGDLLTVLGPFQSGTTSVQVGFTLPHSSPNLTIEQAWPVAVNGLTFSVERVGDLSVASDQFLSTGDIFADDGTPYFLGELPSLPAGGVVTLQLSGLPVHSTLPRNLALAVAVLLLGGGVWLASRGHVNDADMLVTLARRRDTLLGDVARLEARRRSDKESPRDAERRRRLVGELEQIYAELDQASGDAAGGGGDVSA